MSLPDEELTRLVDDVFKAPSPNVLFRISALAEEDLIKVIPRLASTGTAGAILEGFRDGAKAHLAARLCERMVSSASRLEQAIERLRISLTDATDRFNKSSTFLALAMIFIGVVQIVVALLALLKR